MSLKVLRWLRALELSYSHLWRTIADGVEQEGLYQGERDGRPYNLLHQTADVLLACESERVSVL